MSRHRMSKQLILLSCLFFIFTLTSCTVTRGGILARRNPRPKVVQPTKHAKAKPVPPPEHVKVKPHQPPGQAKTKPVQPPGHTKAKPVKQKEKVKARQGPQTVQAKAKQNQPKEQVKVKPVKQKEKAKAKQDPQTVQAKAKQNQPKEQAKAKPVKQKEKAKAKQGPQTVLAKAKPAPSAQAKAHGSAAEHRYYYYPSVSVYYDITKKVYFYLRGDNWTVSSSLPQNLKANLGSHVILKLKTDKPYTHFKDHKAKYPPSQLKKVHKKNKK